MFVSYHLQFIAILQQMLSKVPGDMVSLHKQLTIIMTKYEIHLPMFINRFVQHELLHVPEQIQLLGAFWSHNMLLFERFHVLLKSLAKGSKDIAYSMANAYRWLEPCMTSWRWAPYQNHTLQTPTTSQTITQT